jgi:hypothetical protein
MFKTYIRGYSLHLISWHTTYPGLTLSYNVVKKVACEGKKVEPSSQYGHAESKGKNYIDCVSGHLFI